jgi:exosome complex RNA-binding protein Rrp4
LAASHLLVGDTAAAKVVSAQRVDRAALAVAVRATVARLEPGLLVRVIMAAQAVSLVVVVVAPEQQVGMVLPRRAISPIVAAQVALAPHLLFLVLQ